MRDVFTGPIFRMQRRKLGKSQKKVLSQAISQLKNKPVIGIQNKWDLEDIWGYVYEDHLGKMYLGYKFDDEKIVLISLTRMSVRI